MRRPRRDPFEGINLDDSFVRDARFIEPSAQDRTSSLEATGHPSRGRVLPVRPVGRKLLPVRAVGPSRSVLGRLLRVPRSRAARLLAIIALVAGVTAAALFMFRHHGSRVGLTNGRASGPARQVPARTPALTPPPTAEPVFSLAASWDKQAQPGACLTWKPDPARRITLQVVPCTKPHVDEIVASLDLASAYRAWPGTSVLASLTTTECASAVNTYLGGTDVDPVGPPAGSVTALIAPDRQGWNDGRRVAACVVRRADGVPVPESVRPVPPLASRAGSG